MASKLLPNGRPRIRLLDVARFAFNNYPHTTVAIIYSAFDLYKDNKNGHRMPPSYEALDNLSPFYNAVCIEMESRK